MLEYIDLEEDEQDLEFTYDGLGRRIMVRRGDIELVYQGRVLTFTAVETKKFVYLGGLVIREQDGNNSVQKEYVRGLDLGGGIGGIIYQKKGSDYYYYHYNHKGDVVALTDGDGRLAAFYEYDAWGNTMTEAETEGVENPVVDPAEGGTTQRRNGTRNARPGFRIAQRSRFYQGIVFARIHDTS
jgi:YD repeat-containing protein